MRLCLVEDHAVADLEPLSLSRPAFALRLGATTLAEKAQRAFGIGGSGAVGAVVRPHLAAVLRERAPGLAVNDPAWLTAGPVVAVNARWVPPAAFRPPASHGPWVGLCHGQPACALIGPEQATTLELHGVSTWLEALVGELPTFEVGGQWIARPWDLVAINEEHIVRDFEHAGRVGITPAHRATMALVGPEDRLCIHETARIDPYTVFDTTNGPITIEAGVWIQPFTRVEGPCCIGPKTQLFRANLRGAVSIGPNCRIGGEVEASIVHGHSNKYHEGFLGHAYVGEWVNLGAITSNSDLRNDYGEVCVPLQGDPVPTGLAKVGCFIGDHTRTGMGSMLNTGTSIGVMCNVLPAGPLLPKHVPSFAAVLWGRVAPGFALEQMFATARVVMSRRGQAFTAAEEQLYLELYEQTRLERERAFHRSQEHQPQRWPATSSAFLG